MNAARRLERALQARALPALRALRPGANASKVATIVELERLPVPPDLWWWWEWHDGSTKELYPAARSLSIEEVGRAYRWRRAVAESSVDEEIETLNSVDKWWDRYWLPFFETGGPMTLVVDTSPELQRHPVRQIEWQFIGTERFCPLVAPSLTDLLDRWTRAIELEQVRWDSQNDRWVQ